MNKRSILNAPLMRGISLAALLHFFASFPVFGQWQEYESASKLTSSTKISLSQIPAGSEFKVAIILELKDKWHINSNTPTEDFLIPTSVALSLPPSIIATDISYPKGITLSLGFSDKPLSVYEGVVPIFVTLKASENTTAGLDTIRALVTVQACDDATCLAPSDIDILIPLEYVAADTPVQVQHEDLFNQYVRIAAEEENLIGTLFREEGMLFAFLSIFLVGLALNLTPCVYPMMTVTISLFGAQKESRTGIVFLKALVYVLGISTMYSALGVTAALTGGFFGAWLQSPWVLGGVALLMFALALSQFGVYQIQAPYWLTNKLGGTTGTGFVSLYLSGLVVGIFAAPCVGPAVIALLTFVSTQGDPLFAFWSFFILSLGLGLPYLFLGTFSGLLKKLPRSGIWMMWVEHLFGIALTGAALFYGALAVAPAYSAYVIPIVLLLGGIYLGFIDKSGNEKKAFKNFKPLFGAAIIILSFFIFRGLQAQSVEWEYYTPDRLSEVRGKGKPVILDFYADWCIPCQELDRITFTDPEVILDIERFVRLKVDLTHFDSPASQELRSEYNIGGVPTLVFLDSNGDEVTSARIIGFMNAENFLKRSRTVQ